MANLTKRVRKALSDLLRIIEILQNQRISTKSHRLSSTSKTLTGPKIESFEPKRTAEVTLSLQNRVPELKIVADQKKSKCYQKMKASGKKFQIHDFGRFLIEVAGI